MMIPTIRHAINVGLKLYCPVSLKLDTTSSAGQVGPTGIINGTRMMNGEIYTASTTVNGIIQTQATWVPPFEDLVIGCAGAPLVRYSTSDIDAEGAMDPNLFVCPLSTESLTLYAVNEILCCDSGNAKIPASSDTSAVTKMGPTAYNTISKVSWVQFVGNFTPR
jgi:hypothetical protein